MRKFLAGTVGALLAGTVVVGCHGWIPEGWGGGSLPGDGSGGATGGAPVDAGGGVGGGGGIDAGGGGTNAGGGGLGVGGGGIGGATDAGGGGAGAGGSSGSGGAVAGVGGMVIGMGGAGMTGMGGAVAAGGAGGAVVGVCPPPPTASGWIEVPAPLGVAGLVARDAFAVGVDDLYFAGQISPATGSPSMQVLHWSHGCWTVELSAPLATSQGDPSVHGLPTGELWAAGGDQIYRRRGTQDWAPIDASWHAEVTNPNARALTLTRVRAAASDELWATESNNILHYMGGAWTVTNLDDPYYPNVSGSFSYSYNDIWIDNASSVWIAGASDEVGNTMDPAMLHHFDGVHWKSAAVAQYSVMAMWRAGATFWLAAPGQNLGTLSLVGYDVGTGAAMPVAVTGAPAGSSMEFGRLWGRGNSDLWAAGTDLAHFDGTNWNMVPDEPASARGSGYPPVNTFVTGDAAAVWIVTPGPRFFRKLDAGPTGP